CYGHLLLQRRLSRHDDDTSGELAKRVNQLSILNEISNTAGSSLKTSDLLEHIVICLTQQAKFDRALLLIRSQEGFEFDGIIGDQDSRERFEIKDLSMPRFGVQTYQDLTNSLINHPHTAKLVDTNTLVAIP